MKDEVCFPPATDPALRIRRKDLSARELMQTSPAQNAGICSRRASSDRGMVRPAFFV